MCQITHLGRRGEPYATNWLPTIAPVADPRDAAPQLPEGDGRARHPARRERLWRRGSSLQGGRSRRHRGARRRPSDRAVPVAEDQPADRRVRRIAGEPLPVRPHGVRGDPAPGRRRFHRRHFASSSTRGTTAGSNFEECVAIAGSSNGRARSTSSTPSTAAWTRSAALALRQHAGHGLADRALAATGRRVQAGDDAARLPCGPHLRYRHRPPRHPRGAPRHGGDDARPYRRSPHRGEARRRPRGTRSGPASARPTASRNTARPACTTRRAGARRRSATASRAAEGPARKVVVVGGGPAGLEAARVCAERGHEVVLFEAADRLGGQVLIAARASWRRDLVGIVDWRRAGAASGSASRSGSTPTSRRRTFSPRHPDLVILATGGTPDIDWIPGAEHCTSIWDALTGHARLGAEIIVYDGTGRHPAPQVAELAAARRAAGLDRLDRRPACAGADLCRAGDLEEADLRARPARPLRSSRSNGSSGAATASPRPSATC